MTDMDDMVKAAAACKPCGALRKKLLEVRRSVTAIEKDAVNNFQHYRYASSAAVLGALREAMDREGVLLVPSLVDVAFRNESLVGTGKDGKEIWSDNVLTAKIIYTWMDADSDEKLECQWYGVGSGEADKCLGKLGTYAEKYFLTKFFQIPTEANDDPDHGTTRRVAQPVAPTADVANEPPAWMACELPPAPATEMCHKCGARMKVRQSKTRGAFLGCSTYPQCNATRELPSSREREREPGEEG